VKEKSENKFLSERMKIYMRIKEFIEGIKT